jgi:hypothetical protein
VVGEDDRMVMWHNVDNVLPRDGQAVLVRRAGDNWSMNHTLENGDSRKIWRWVAVKFIRGKTPEEVAKMERPSYGSADEFGNNLKPYCWVEFGPGDLFGQDVTTARSGLG